MVLTKWIEKYSYVLLFLIVLLGAFLRIYKVTEVPPGLYIDEISIAYNANEILTKGVDQYGVRYPLWFKAFGEYKMPVYIYSVAGSLAVFGRNDFAVRFPSISSGILTLLVFYFLMKKILELNKKPFGFSPVLFSVISTFFLAVSTWHIQFSRAGFEANMALFLYLLAILCFVYFEKKRLWLLIFGFIFLAVSAYTYDGYRFISPVTAIVVSGIFFKQKEVKYSLSGFILFIVLMVPLIQFSLTGAGAERLSETSAFSGLNLSFVGKLIQYPMIYLRNYLSYFSSQFLFNMGDGIGRHELPDFGVLQYWQVPFLILGILIMFKTIKSNFSKLTLFLLLITPIAPALTAPSPHTLRSLLLVIPLTILVALGFIFAVLKLWSGKKKILVLVILIFMIYEYAFYLHYYYGQYAAITSIDWGGGYKQTVEKAVVYSKKYHVVVEKTLDNGGSPRVFLYFGFYTNDKFAPQIVSNSFKPPKDWEKGTTIFVRPYYGQRSNQYIIDNVYLPGPNNDIFSQFWKI